MVTFRSDDDLIQVPSLVTTRPSPDFGGGPPRLSDEGFLFIVRHQKDAEDAMQETLFRVYINLGSHPGAQKESQRCGEKCDHQHLSGE